MLISYWYESDGFSLFFFNTLSYFIFGPSLDLIFFQCFPHQNHHQTIVCFICLCIQELQRHLQLLASILIQIYFQVLPIQIHEILLDSVFSFLPSYMHWCYNITYHMAYIHCHLHVSAQFKIFSVSNISHKHPHIQLPGPHIFYFLNISSDHILHSFSTIILAVVWRKRWPRQFWKKIGH